MKHAQASGRKGYQPNKKIICPFHKSTTSNPIMRRENRSVADVTKIEPAGSKQATLKYLSQ